MDSESTAEGSGGLEDRLLSSDELLDDGEAFWADGPENRQKRGWCSRPRWMCCVLCGILLAVFAGIGMPLLVDNFVYKGIESDVIIDSEAADGFDQFRDKRLTGDTTIEFYLFNITNPKGILRGHKPQLEEVGPFVYNTFQYRSDFRWDEDADTVTFREHSYYVFDREKTLAKTAGRFDSDQVKVLTLNLLFQGMRAQVGTFYWKEICDKLLWKTDMHRLFTNRKVVEMLNGYEEKLEILGFKVPIRFPGIYPNLTKWKDPTYRKKTVMRVGKKDMNQVYELISVEGHKHVRVKCPYGANPLPGGEYCPHKYPCCQVRLLFLNHFGLFSLSQLLSKYIGI